MIRRPPSSPLFPYTPLSQLIRPNTAAACISRFFAVTFPAEMASAGMEGLQEFMVFPDNLDDILARLEDARQRIYK